MSERPPPRILFLTHRVPYPPDKGDRIRTFHTLRTLARHAEVHLACLADEPVPAKHLAALRPLCADVVIVPIAGGGRWVRGFASLLLGGTVSEGTHYSPALATSLRQCASKTAFAAMLVSASSLVQYLDLRELRDIPTVVDMIDVDSQKWFDYAAASRPPLSWLYHLEGARLRRLEAKLPKRVRGVVLVSAAETELYRRFALPGEGQIEAVTNGVDLEYFHPGGGATADPESSCVFVGALDYRPNIDAACWFVETVWPGVRQSYPEARFRIVGRRPAPAVVALGTHPGVEVIGQVPDVRPHVLNSTVVVAPLRIARGLQNKVLEALAMARPVVASPQALAGLSARVDTEVLQASSPEEWVQALGRLFLNPALRHQLGQAGRTYAEAHHNWHDCLEPLFPLLGIRGNQTPGGRVVSHGSGIRGGNET